MAGGRNEKARERRRNQLKKTLSFRSMPRSDMLSIRSSISQRDDTLDRHFGWQVLKKTRAGDEDFPNLTTFLEKPDLSGKDFQKVTYVLYVENGMTVDTETDLKSTQTSGGSFGGRHRDRDNTSHGKPYEPDTSRGRGDPSRSESPYDKKYLIRDFIYVPVEERTHSQERSRSRSRSKARSKAKGDADKSTEKEHEEPVKEKRSTKGKSEESIEKKRKIKDDVLCKTVEEFGREKVECLHDILNRSSIILQKDEIVCKTESQIERENEELIKVFLKGGKTSKICKTVEEFEREKVESLNEYLIGSKSVIPQRDEVICKSKSQFEKEKEEFIEDILKAASRERSKSKDKKAKNKGWCGKSKDTESIDEHSEKEKHKDKDEKKDKKSKKKGWCGKSKDAESTDVSDNEAKDDYDKHKDKAKKEKPTNKHKKPNRWALRAGAENCNSFFGSVKDMQKMENAGEEDSGDYYSERSLIKNLKPEPFNRLKTDAPSEILLETPSGMNQYLYVSQGKYKKRQPAS